MNDLGTRKWWALAALALSMLAVGLDATIINIALPTLSTALHATTSQLQWFVDAYSLALAALLLPAGLLGDRFGRKRLLLAALLTFGASSAACAYAPTAGALIVARTMLGLSGAFMMPLSLAVLPVIFTEEERPRALAIWITANALSFPIGPILGGWLLSNYWWGSVFLINVPITLLGFAAVLVLLPESRSAERPHLDVGGMLASCVGLAAVTYGCIEAGEKGWGDPGTVAALAGGACVLAAFVLWERHVSAVRAGRPLVDLTLFRSANFTWGTLLATAVSFAMFGVLFAGPQFFQAVTGSDALGTGIRLIPIIAGLLVGSQSADRLAPRLGAKLTAAAGFSLLALGLGLGAATTVESGYGFVVVWIFVVGMGMGFALPATMDAAMSVLSAERSGAGSALIMAMRQVGATIGVAILGTILNTTYRAKLDVSRLPAGLASTARDSVSAGVAVARRLGSGDLLRSVQSAYVHGMDELLVVCAGVGVVGVVLALAFLPRRGVAPSGDRAKQVELEHEIVA